MVLPFDNEARLQLGDTLHRYLHGRARDASPGEPDANEAAFARYRLVPRVLTGTRSVTIEARLLGQTFGAPIALGAYAGDLVFTPDGLKPLARIAAALRLPLLVSEETMTPLAELTRLHDGCWLQLRAAGPVERVLALATGGREAGIAALVLTVLAPTHPRPGLSPGGFSIGKEIAARGVSTIGATSPGVAPLPTFPQWGWGEIGAVKAHCAGIGLPLVLKGVLHGDDARKAAAAGVAGLVVSNIGLRQSSRWATSLEQLPQIRAAAPDLPLLLDGGVRSGADVLVALLAGANCAVATRPLVTALASGGEARAQSMLAGWIDELAALTVWMGAERPSDLAPDQLVRDQ